MPLLPKPDRLTIQETLSPQLGIALNALEACPGLLAREHSSDTRDSTRRYIALIRDDCQDLLRNHSFYTSDHGHDLDAHDKSMIALRQKIEGHRDYFRKSKVLLPFPFHLPTNDQQNLHSIN